MKKMSTTYLTIVAIMVTGIAVTAAADSPNEVTKIKSSNNVVVTTTTEAVKIVNQTQADRYEPSIDTTSTTSTVETTTPPIPPVNDAKCPEYWATAVDAGWDPSLLSKLDTIMFRESSCNFDSYNPKDPAGGSYGLMQINGYWCESNKYNPNGWLQGQGVVNNCQDLFDPVINLKAALALFHYSLDRHGCGWSPWRFC